ncbi:MAG TPA: FHA domain-containing protein [Bryobacteraceae bacterium]|nr:FHA domain-containing protein [Bryobacteraceae bacterium]
MQAVLQVTTGPHTGRIIVVQQGMTFRIGRTTKADYAISEDTFLSGAHFCIEWAGDACVVRDLNSSNGTYLNGTRMSEGLLQAGDVITAGQSSFTIAYEGVASGQAAGRPVVVDAPTQAMRAITTVPEDEGVKINPALTASRAFRVPPVQPPPLPVQAPPPPPSPPSSVSARVTAALEVMRGLADPVAAIFDLRSGAPCLQRLRDSGVVVEPLNDQMALFIVEPDSPACATAVGEAWGNGWSIYVTSRSPLAILRNHLRRFATMLSSDGVEFKFRLADPALMGAFLSGMSGEEARAFFGPIAALILESASGDELLLFMAGRDGTLHKPMPLGVGGRADSVNWQQ